MILPIRPICKPRWVRRDGTSKIFLQYCYSASERTLVDTGIAIPPAFWDKRRLSISKKLPSEYGPPEALQQQLTCQLRKAQSIVQYALSKRLHPLQFLKLTFSSDIDLKDFADTPAAQNASSIASNNVLSSFIDDRDGNGLLLEGRPVSKMRKKESLPKRSAPELFHEIELFLKEKEGMISRKAWLAFTGMRDRLLAFQKYRGKRITFSSFDYSFYEEFLKFLTYEIPQKRRKSLVKGFKKNSVGKTINRLTTFLRDRMRKGIIPYADLKDYKGPQEETDHVYVSWTELSLIYHLDLSDRPELEKHRDLFVLGCLTGFRFSDYSEIQPEEVRQEMLFVRQTKTNSTVVVPLRADARAILIDKYHMRMPQLSNVKFNVQIKEVARLAGLTEKIKISHRKGTQVIEEVRPKYAWVTSHTCRRSFCTNEYLAGTPVDLIMMVSGHRTEKSFRRYIKADGLQKAEMIKKIWDSRPGL